MKIRNFCLVLGAMLVTDLSQAARPLTEARFTEVINDVNVVAPDNKTAKPVKIEDLFKSPEILRTGAESRAELTAPDKTITRVGANTVFSFEPKGRNIHLNQGSILFHSPSGKGGGTIRSGGASASVLGTTILVVTTLDGGFKMIVLEGKGQVRLPNGDFRILQAGQLAFVLPGARHFGPVLNVNLDKLVQGAGLVQSFPKPLSSIDRIQNAVARQQRLISQGRAQDTGLLVGRAATRDEVRVINPVTQEIAVNSEGLARAFTRDAHIERPVLDPARVFVTAVAFPNEVGPPAAERSFVGRNISIQTPTIDMRPYTRANANAFAFHASEKIEIKKSVTFDGGASPAFDLFLLGEEGVKIEHGSTLIANNVGDFHVRSGKSIEFEDVDFENKGAVELSAKDKLVLKGMTADETSIKAGSLILNAVRGDLTLHDASLNAPTMTLRAGEKLTLERTTLTGLTSISMDARTLNLRDVNFPANATVSLRSQLGLLAPNPNTGRSPVPGHVNFINNVNYGGAPAQFAVGNGITISARP